MPHNPGHAKFLTSEEKMLTMAYLKHELHGATAEENVDNEHFDWHWVKMAFASPNLYITSLAWFFVLIPLYSFSLFLPTIIQALGFTTVKAQLLTVPPNFAAFLCVLLTTFFSDRIRMRGPVMLVGSATAIIGYAMLLGSKSANVRYGGTFFVACGVFICSPAVMAWLSGNLSPPTTSELLVQVFRLPLQTVQVRRVPRLINVGTNKRIAFVATFTYLSKDA